MGDYIVGVFDRDELNCKVVSTMMNSVEAALCLISRGLVSKITFSFSFGLLPLFLGVNREQGVVVEAVAAIVVALTEVEIDFCELG